MRIKKPYVPKLWRSMYCFDVLENMPTPMLLKMLKDMYGLHYGCDVIHLKIRYVIWILKCRKVRNALF